MKREEFNGGSITDLRTVVSSVPTTSKRQRPISAP